MNNNTTHDTHTSQQASTADSSPLAYAIKRWSSRFENAQSRRTKDLNHSLTPHELNSTHLEHLMSKEGGPTALAVWHILIQLATRCPQRGLLVDEDGPLTDKTIAKACHLTEAQVSKALSLLMSESIDWLDIVGCPQQILVTGSMRSGRKGRPKMPEVLHVKGITSGPDFHIERMISVVEHIESDQNSPQFKTVEVLPYEFEVLLNPKKEEENPALEHTKEKKAKGTSKENALEHMPEDTLLKIIKHWNSKGGKLKKITVLSVETWYDLMKFARNNPTMAGSFIPGINVIEQHSLKTGKHFTFEEVLKESSRPRNAA